MEFVDTSLFTIYGSLIFIITGLAIYYADTLTCQKEKF